MFGSCECETDLTPVELISPYPAPIDMLVCMSTKQMRQMNVFDNGEIDMMKRFTLTICAGVMMMSTGAVLAKDHKVSICHNGSTYDSATMMEAPISFVITIAGKRIAKAVDKHVANHGDLETYQELGEGEECELLDDGTVACDTVMLCGPVL